MAHHANSRRPAEDPSAAPNRMASRPWLSANCAGHSVISSVALATVDKAPPEPMDGEPWIWLSATTVAREGAELAAAVVNPTGSLISYGVIGVFERWSEERWSRAGTWLTSLDH